MFILLIIDVVRGSINWIVNYFLDRNTNTHKLLLLLYVDQIWQLQNIICLFVFCLHFVSEEIRAGKQAQQKFMHKFLYFSFAGTIFLFLFLFLFYLYQHQHQQQQRKQRQPQESKKKSVTSLKSIYKTNKIWTTFEYWIPITKTIKSKIMVEIG